MQHLLDYVHALQAPRRQAWVSTSNVDKRQHGYQHISTRYEPQFRVAVGCQSRMLPSNTQKWCSRACCCGCQGSSCQHVASRPSNQLRQTSARALTARVDLVVGVQAIPILLIGRQRQVQVAAVCASQATQTRKPCLGMSIFLTCLRQPQGCMRFCSQHCAGHDWGA